MGQVRNANRQSCVAGRRHIISGYFLVTVVVSVYRRIGGYELGGYELAQSPNCI
jgi:hypothetical protein